MDETYQLTISLPVVSQEILWAVGGFVYLAIGIFAGRWSYRGHRHTPNSDPDCLIPLGLVFLWPLAAFVLLAAAILEPIWRLIWLPLTFRNNKN